MRRIGLTGIALAWFAGSAAAQNFPEKPVTLIAPFTAGGSVDLVARALAQQMSEQWKQPVIVSNRPGASGNIGVEAAVRAAPDGYTLLIGTTALSSSPALFPKLPFDPVRDLTPVSLVVTNLLVNAGADAVGNTPEEFARFSQSEIAKWGKVVKAAGITGE